MKRIIMTVLIGLFAVPMIFAGTTKYTGSVQISENLTVDGTSTLTGAVSGAVTGDVTTTDISIDGTFVEPPGDVVQLDTSTALGSLESFVVVIGSNAASGAFAMTSDATPFLSTTTAVNGQVVEIMGTSDTGTVTLSDNGTVAGSLLELDGNTVTLNKGSNISFRYYEGSWYQNGGVNIID